MTINQPFTSDEYGEESDPFGYENDPEDQKRLAILLGLIPEERISRVLDLGCGNGFITSNILMPVKTIFFAWEVKIVLVI